MEFELGSILKLVKRRLLFIIVLCIAAVGLAGSVSYYVLQPKYEATASILIQGDRQQKAINDIMAGQKAGHYLRGDHSKQQDSGRGRQKAAAKNDSRRVTQKC